MMSSHSSNYSNYYGSNQSRSCRDYETLYFDPEDSDGSSTMATRSRTSDGSQALTRKSNASGLVRTQEKRAMQALVGTLTQTTKDGHSVEVQFTGNGVLVMPGKTCYYSNHIVKEADYYYRCESCNRLICADCRERKGRSCCDTVRRV